MKYEAYYFIHSFLYSLIVYAFLFVSVFTRLLNLLTFDIVEVNCWVRLII